MATNAERLTALLKKALPKDTRIDSGEWGKDGPPYVFTTLDDGRQRLQVINAETGDTIGVVGNSRDELLTALEARLS